MKYIQVILLALLTSPIAIAVSEDASNSSVKSTEVNGTTITTEQAHTNSVNAKGVTKSSENTKTVVNPKGMMNEQVSETHTERRAEPNGDFSNSTTVHHANGTDEKELDSKSTAKHWTNKGKTTTTSSKHIVDPKGLGNKHDHETREVVETNPDGSEKKTNTEEIDGNVVSENMNSKN